eukprot:scaffold34727_cov180-Isochrysis_galbana.AAC.1
MCLQDSSLPRKGCGKAPTRWSISLGTRGVDSFSRPLGHQRSAWSRCRPCVRVSGPRMLAWITYGGPDGSGAIDLDGGTLFSYFFSEVRTRGNNRVKVAAFLTPVYSRNAQQMFE